ncbi:hypothetical protein SUGI_0999330 [Cryptomeria japonica]|uniref:protein NBR1 homolog n=1 Tax=Cryptomeria japonica TaxID=3369 RepID=UPI0024148C2D|nr:protein NBR1 homolog [Cryptomeria japonica]GLJ47335.1 hypothetical protein SUGI_0999330 [Cryptomeria japonica]
MSARAPSFSTCVPMQLVLKVKYNDTLRRLTISLKEDGSPDISLEALKSKICELFKFRPNTQILITYTDEDADVVTMVDDVDFLDAVRQGLNPLRLDVSVAANQRPNLSIPSATGEERNAGLDATLDALRRLSDPTWHLRRLAEIPAVISVLSCPEVSGLMEGLLRVGTSQLGPLFENLAASNPNTSRTPGNNINSPAN